MKIIIISVGKKHDPLLKDAIEEYERRITHHFQLSWQIIPSQDRQTAQEQKTAETRKIIEAIPASSTVILLDERGSEITSPQLSTLLTNTKEQVKTIVCIIGGAYGVDLSLLHTQTKSIRFGKMVIAHQIMRLVLVEQLYRAIEIARSSNYHHD